jgi:hypothetical protein
VTPDEARKFFENKQTDFRVAFNSDAGKRVLADLAPFCRAHETCFIPGAQDKSLVLEGRREVWLRIRDFLDRTPGELIAIYTQPLEGDKAHARPDPDPHSDS